ncbi:hypothetical protein L6452_05047 [Arctium lappa]|uniref:Uncharacterized protein n=1 Tax=Arctium lappa TaxID=4217 RepID=A0ACB9EFA6_ARCLA|nr:hypothetical protein L6452_05047 [Arctium lappa]
MEEEQRTHQNPFRDLTEAVVEATDTPTVYSQFLCYLKAIPPNHPQARSGHRLQKKVLLEHHHNFQKPPLRKMRYPKLHKPPQSRCPRLLPTN